MRADQVGRTILVDCLTLWASNLMLAGKDVVLASDDLVGVIAASRGAIVLVTNEVGWGIVPDNALARRFRDVAGRLNQRIAAAVGDVHLIVVGCPFRKNDGFVA
jgi:adenosylcobinamide kinase/adenosylcobinamide-phosphate guanylyltransferase